MTFEARDKSVYSGAPIELYDLTVGATTYYWTSGDDTISYGGHSYVPEPLLRKTLVQGQEPGRSGFTLSVPLNHPVGIHVLIPGLMLSDPVSLVLRAGHRTDAEFWTLFIGVLAGIETDDRNEDGRVDLQFARLDGRLGRQVPRMQLGRTCQNMLYDELCALSPTSFKFDSTVTGIGLVDQREVTVEGLNAVDGTDPGRFLGGVLLKAGRPLGWVVARGSGNILYLVDPHPDLAVGDNITLYAGCDRTIETCVNRFDNVTRFNGWHAIPHKNPFEGRGLEDEADDYELTRARDPDGRSTAGATDTPRARP